MKKTKQFMAIGSAFLALLAVSLPSPAHAADKPVEIVWENLIPASALKPIDKQPDWSLPPQAPGPTDEFSQFGQQSTQPAPLVTSYNGKSVRIAGYVVPLDFEATTVKKFLLVPYVGACIHVPPPPQNQIIYVEIEKAIEVTGLFDPIYVTGIISTGSMSTELAEVGYRMKANATAPYEE